MQAEPLQVYAVSRHDELGEPEELVSVNASTKPRRPLRAAMSRDGSSWALAGRSSGVRLFVDGEEKVIPPIPWAVVSVGFSGTDVIAKVLPWANEPVGPDEELEPPLVMRYDGSSWETLVETERYAEAIRNTDRSAQAKRHEQHIGSTQGGGFWLAGYYAYRLQKYSSSGVLETEIVVGQGEIEWTDRGEEEFEAIEKAAKRQGVTLSRSRLPSQKAVTAIQGMTVGADGRVYLVVSGALGKTKQKQDHPFLDRWDPLEQRLQRRGLPGLPGVRMTVAAGRSGLYVAGGGGSMGRWVISWEDLEGGEWADVDDYTIDGEAPFWLHDEAQEEGRNDASAK